jgi:ABC-type nitrate/sulfonate/bicarbonate transport system substrate-binding protein
MPRPLESSSSRKNARARHASRSHCQQLRVCAQSRQHDFVKDGIGGDAAHATYLCIVISLRIGFVPLVDGAPLIIAKEKGFFERQGLGVDLRKAQSWDQAVSWLASGEVDAAHMLVTAPIQWALGPRGGADPFAYAVSLSSHGNAITLSNGLWRAGARDPEGLRAHLASVGKGKPPRFAVVHPRSTHEYLLRLWLARANLEAGRDVVLDYVPPHEMVHALREGRVDGFCAGEPWNQRAASSKLGYIAATSCDVLPPMSEKVLAVRTGWHRENGAIHAALLRAVLEAGDWLAERANLDETVAIVSGKRYVNTALAPVRAALSGSIHAGGGRVLAPPGFLRFSGHGSNYPDPNHARFYLERMWRAGHVSGAQAHDLEVGAICLDGFYRDTVESSGGPREGRFPDVRDESYPAFLKRIPDFQRDDKY